MYWYWDCIGIAVGQQWNLNKKMTRIGSPTMMAAVNRKRNSGSSLVEGATIAIGERKHTKRCSRLLDFSVQLCYLGISDC